MLIKGVLTYGYSLVEINRAIFQITQFILVRDAKLLNQIWMIKHHEQKLSKVIYLLLEDAVQFKAIKWYKNNDKDNTLAIKKWLQFDANAS